MRDGLRIQLWSAHYEPEPTGIGPMSRTFVDALRSRGHEVEVIAAHPHYPEAEWGRKWRPYREVRDGIPVLRLPLWVGRESGGQRVRQEGTIALAHLAAIPFLRKPDVSLVVSPSFPALLPAMLAHRSWQVPWALWLHDILPDGATATGLVHEHSRVIRASRRLELAAYRRCDRIAVISGAFVRNLEEKGVPRSKIELISLPATREPRGLAPQGRPEPAGPLRVLTMGNIGFSQNLSAVVRAWEASEIDAVLHITGAGVAFDDVAREVRTDRVRMLGLVSDDELERELAQADMALVSQTSDGVEFNVPSKLMNFMAYGLPVIATVNPDREVARVVGESGGGWIVDASRPEDLPSLVASLRDSGDEIRKRGEAARSYAAEHFSQEGFAGHLDALMRETLRVSQVGA
ncbi:MAG: glycosyltransferase family 4 protein [Aeromicrobium sp.]